VLTTTPSDAREPDEKGVEAGAKEKNGKERNLSSGVPF